VANDSPLFFFYDAPIFTISPPREIRRNLEDNDVTFLRIDRKHFVVLRVIRRTRLTTVSVLSLLVSTHFVRRSTHTLSIFTTNSQINNHRVTSSRTIKYADTLRRCLFIGPIALLSYFRRHSGLRRKQTYRLIRVRMLSI